METYRRFRPIAILLAALVCSAMGTGCASSSDGSWHQIQRQQVVSRDLAIASEWRDYENRVRRRVVYPDWRSLSFMWARHEARVGRPICGYHPPGYCGGY